MTSTRSRIQAAIFEKITDGSSWLSLSTKYSVDDNKLRRTYTKWLQSAPSRRSIRPEDIDIEDTTPGRPPTFLPAQEAVIVEAIKYFAENNTPLTKTEVCELVQHYVELLPPTRREEIVFNDNRPSLFWVRAFLSLQDLCCKTVRAIDYVRVSAVTLENVAEHIARVDAAMQRYNIRDARFIYNMDLSGSSFNRMSGRSLRKGIGTKGATLIQSVARTKGNLDRITVQATVSAAGVAYKPVIVFPGKQAHYRYLHGSVQTLHTFLPPCYFYQRSMPGVDSAIIFDWAQNFIEETRHLRTDGQKLLLIIDGYGSHVQLRTLQLFKDNGFIAITLPSNTFHVLQPLDVTVFGSYKSTLQKVFHEIAERRRDSMRST